MYAGLIPCPRYFISPVTLTLDFNVKFWNSRISGMGGPIDMERKGCESIESRNYFVTLIYGLDLDLDLWPWPWIFNVKFSKIRIPEMGRPIDMDRKECGSIGRWAQSVTLNFDLTHDLDLGFSRSNFERVYIRNGRVDWHGTKGLWVDRISDPQCNLELWPLPRTFKVKFENNRIPGMGWPNDMQWKGCESIDCWTHYVILIFDITHDPEPGIGRSIDTNEMDVSRIRCSTHYATLNFDLNHNSTSNLRIFNVNF